jgi:hypothetical protein
MKLHAASYGVCSSSRNRPQTARLHDGVSCGVERSLLYGVPLLMHSLLYSNQLDHHNPRQYGTSADGEYLPMASAPIRETLLYLAQIPFLLILAVFRFLILAPLSLLHPRWRQRLLARGSSYGFNPYDRRILSPMENLGLWAVLDLAGFCLLARDSLAATSNQYPMHLWLDAKVEP